MTDDDPRLEQAAAPLAVTAIVGAGIVEFDAIASLGRPRSDSLEPKFSTNLPGKLSNQRSLVARAGASR